MGFTVVLMQLTNCYGFCYLLIDIRRLLCWTSIEGDWWENWNVCM